ncbi:AAA family ATPase [bacterium]|nr:AAA family ATPase [bacterium]
MQKLPIGIQNFEDIRKEDFVYIDKTKKILQLIQNGKCYFLSRPRRFGKSLTISTLEAMFKGKAELFKGLYAEEWVKEQSKNPNPVMKLDMGDLGNYENTEEFKYALIYIVKKVANDYNLNISYDETISKNAGLIFSQVINELYKQIGKVIVLIDEYDKPITDNIDNLEKANKMRETLRSFYSVLKNRDEVKFIMITGVSKFTKTGVFSCLNNLEDISMTESHSDIVGYTQEELENYFGEWLENIKIELSMDKEELLEKIKKYYDGFSFDGIVRVYNPFSVLNFFKQGRFRNYWYNSATPSFLVKYFKKHHIKNPDIYEQLKVKDNFADKHEIETASVESFLYQAGYLTIKNWRDNEITLDYPNEEVKSSLADMYLDDVYHIEGYMTLGEDIWKSLEESNIENLVKIFNIALKGVPYEDFKANSNIESDEYSKYRIINEVSNEYWYRSMFVMLLRGAGIMYYAEVHTFRGRSDVVIVFKNKIVVIEFKFAKTSSEIEAKRKEGEEQIKSRDYASPYEGIGKEIITAVLIANDEKRQVSL